MIDGIGRTTSDRHIESVPTAGLGVRQPIGRFEHHDEPHPDGLAGLGWYSLQHRLIMEPGEATLPIPPIK